MKTFYTVIVTAGICCGTFILRDFGRDIQRDITARKEFVSYANQHDAKDGISFRTAGFLDKTMVFQGIPCDGADCQYLLDETVHPESDDAYGRNYREYLVQIGFKEVCVNGLCAALPNTQTLNPASGKRDFHWVKVS